MNARLGSHSQRDWPSWVPPLLAVAFSMAVSLVVVAATSPSLVQAITAFVEGAFGSPYALAATINRTAVLALTGLGFLFAARANLCNVGGEGQIAIGGAVATALALYGGAAQLPGPLAWIYPAAGAFVAGSIWGAAAGVLKARFGTNEVISTLMLTFIGVWLVYWATHSDAMLRQPRTSSTSLPESLEIPQLTRLPVMTEDPASPVHIGIVVAAAVAAVLWLVLRRGSIGTRLKALGLNEQAAYALGLDRAALTIVALGVAGGLSGLAGALMIQGEQLNLKAGFSSGYGFDGLVIGLLARGSPWAVLGYAAFFAFLRSGGISMEIGAGVPSAVVVMMQGLIVVTVAAAAFLGSARMARA